MKPLLKQKYGWDCGPTCLINALCLRGRIVEWDDAVRWLKATEANGTSAAALKRVLGWLRVPYKEYSSPGLKRSWSKLTHMTLPAILPVDLDDHWILVVSGVGRRIVVFDPEVGLGVYGRKEFMSRWVNCFGKFYGIFLQ